ncbi:MAG: GldG family protein [Gammaproteobacteria bacterium]|nr:GldG family protein [Gammaproteobacteria bacterium]
MKVTPQIRTRFKLQNTAFIVLFLAIIGLLAFLSQRYNYEADWTQHKRHTLSAASIALLATIEQAITLSVYATEDDEVRQPINDLLQRYVREKPSIRLQYINPELEPELVRELGIRVNGEIIIELSGRTENITQASEQVITNALQRLARSEERWLLFVQGHGERKAEGNANHDLGEWGKQLQAKGIKLRSFNITDNPVIPQNIAALVIASPQLDYLDGEVEILKQYIASGGNLLWFVEPGSLHNLRPLAEVLDMDFQAGTIVDPNTQLLGIQDPRFSLISEYSQHAITTNLNALTIYPQARGLIIRPTKAWQRSVIMQTLPRSWAETGMLSGQLDFDADADIAGPLVLGVAMTRTLSDKIGQAAMEGDNSDSHGQVDNASDSESSVEPNAKQQRVVIIGDGDFLSNAYLGNGGNLQLGLSMANWLSYDDRFIAIPTKMRADISLELSRNTQFVIAFGFLLIIPLLLGGSGFMIWFKRRQY